MNILRKIGGAFFRIVFPVECFSCGTYGSWWCDQCQDRVPFIQTYACLGCGNTSVRGETCYACVRRGVPFDGFLSATVYHEQQTQAAIRYLKYSGVKDLATPLGGFLARVFQDSPLTDEWWHAMAVPLFVRRERMRGFNQSRCLAEAFSAETGIAVLPGLHRIRATYPQIELSGDERRKNMEANGIFRVEHPDMVAGKRILLIDDVATTGSTMAACARVLKEAGAVAVWGLAVAHG